MKLDWIDRGCPLCGSSDGSIFVEANIDTRQLDGYAFASRKVPEYMHPRLIECSGCRLLYANPALTPGTLSTAYAEASYDSGEEARFASAVYAMQVRRLTKPSGDALDIGAGDGSFLEELLAMGFSSVTGVEPSRAPREAAKPEIRARIRGDVFKTEDFCQESFSLVTCFQTLEHVPDPAGIARGVHGLLRSGGAFVIAVHNRKALTAKLLGTKSPIFDIEHLQLFCPSTARRLLEEAGYGNVRVSSLWNTYPLRYWLRLFPAPATVKARLLKLAQTSVVGRISLSIPAGNLICAGYKI